LSTKIQQLQRLKALLLLSRPLNLFIVGITMYITRHVVLTDVLSKGFTGDFILTNPAFGLLVLAAMLITAAGNIINDYFDQKVDKINKPERVFIGKTISRRTAILMHQLLNLSAVGLVAWVSYPLHYWRPMAIPVLIMTLLWWYSPVIKKKPILGNLLVACCTALVPVFAVIYDVQLLELPLKSVTHGSTNLFLYTWMWIFGISGFAFVLTMIREVVKDAQDIPGDRTADYQTLPIVWGINRTRRYVLAWMLVFIGMVWLCMTRLSENRDILLFTVLLILPWFMAMIKLRKAGTSQDFAGVSFWIKAIMIGGLLLLLLIL
jgi:4-hydroxybenzoate polyprenyltransferase